MQQIYPQTSKTKLQVEFPSQITFLTSNTPVEKPKTSTRQCRICLQDQTQEINSMIQPCKCLGSIKYVHDSCMKKWIHTTLIKKTYSEQQKLKAQGIQCEMCKYLIKFQAGLETQCREWESVKQEFTSRLSLFLLLFFVFAVSMTGIGCTVWIMKSTLLEMSQNMRVTFFYILGICGLILLSVFIVLGVYILITELFLIKVLKISKIYRKQTNQSNQRYFKSRNQIIPISYSQLNDSGDITIVPGRISRNQQRQ